MRTYVSKGTCSACNSTFSKSTMTRHLASCAQRKAALSGADGANSVKTRGFHIVAEGRHSPEYWIHLSVSSGATLKALDTFLRRIWLECCGHLSAFTIDGIRYSISPDREYDDRGMRAAVGDILSPGKKFLHEYDFGTTTELTLRVVSELEIRPKSKPVELLARNEPLPIACESCGNVAAQVCTECVFSGEGWLCNDCAASHECGEEMLLPVVNSPRVGMCAYTG